MRDFRKHVSRLRNDQSEPTFPSGDSPVDRMERMAIQLAGLALEMKLVTERLKEDLDAGRGGPTPSSGSHA